MHRSTRAPPRQPHRDQALPRYLRARVLTDGYWNALAEPVLWLLPKRMSTDLDGACTRGRADAARIVRWLWNVLSATSAFVAVGVGSEPSRKCRQRLPLVLEFCNERNRFSEKHQNHVRWLSRCSGSPAPKQEAFS